MLKKLNYQNIKFKIGDGHDGWQNENNFDAVIVTAATKQLPEILLEQLAIGGRMIIPLELNGLDKQVLLKIIKTSKNNNYTYEELLDVRFVPMIKL